jgi:hypothetical protein
MVSILGTSERMENGASVSDWLGTAAVSARIAAKDMERCREAQIVSLANLRDIQASLEEALKEIKTIQKEKCGV